MYSFIYQFLGVINISGFPLWHCAFNSSTIQPFQQGASF